MDKSPTASQREVLDKTTAEVKAISMDLRSLNFRISRSLLQILMQSIKKARLRSGDHNGPVDATTSEQVGFVASLHKNLRGFSERNLLDLQEFYFLFDKCESYNLDLFCLRTDAAATLPRIPYIQEAFQCHPSPRGAARDDTNPLEDVSEGARDAVQAALRTCSLSTTFSVHTEPPELQMTMLHWLGSRALGSCP